MTRARNRPKMFGSKNTELTVKYACTALAAISLGFRRIVLVAYSTKPTTANRTASPASKVKQPRVRRGVQSSRRSRQNASANGT